MRALIGPDLLRNLPPGNVDIRDTKLTGFVLRKRTSGAHTYRLQLGRGQWRTLGTVAKMTPVDARAAAEALRGSVSRDAVTRLSDDPTLNHREALAAARRAVRATGRHLTLRAFLADHYEPWVLEHRRSGAETVAVIRSRFPDFLETPLRDLSAFALERWRSGRLKDGAAPATVNRNFAALRGALSKALEWRMLKAHPMATVRGSKVDTTGVLRFLSADEETRLRDALTARDDRRRDERVRANVWRRERGYDELPVFDVYTDHLHPIVLVALNTGCRRGELLDLTWRDVDLPAARLTVRAATAKSGKARVIPLNPEAVKVLTTWRPAGFDPGAFVFPGDAGERMHDLKTAFLKLVRDAAIVGFRFHDLRHTFASRLVQAGVDLNRLRVLLGHADTKMVIRYAHLRDEDLVAAVAAIGRTS